MDWKKPGRRFLFKEKKTPKILRGDVIKQTNKTNKQTNKQVYRGETAPQQQPQFPEKSLSENEMSVQATTSGGNSMALRRQGQETPPKKKNFGFGKLGDFRRWKSWRLNHTVLTTVYWELPCLTYPSLAILRVCDLFGENVSENVTLSMVVGDRPNVWGWRSVTAFWVITWSPKNYPCGSMIETSPVACGLVGYYMWCDLFSFPYSLSILDVLSLCITFLGLISSSINQGEISQKPCDLYRGFRVAWAFFMVFTPRQVPTHPPNHAQILPTHPPNRTHSRTFKGQKTVWPNYNTVIPKPEFSWHYWEGPLLFTTI